MYSFDFSFDTAYPPPAEFPKQDDCLGYMPITPPYLDWSSLTFPPADYSTNNVFSEPAESSDVSSPTSSTDESSPYFFDEYCTMPCLVDQLRENPNIWAIANTVKKGAYVCSHCSKQGNPVKFKTMVEFATHLDSHSHDRSCKCADLQCPWSIVGFSTRSEMRRHANSVHRQTPFSCKICDRGFVREDSLKRHVKLLHISPLKTRRKST
ncbi:Zinc finger protein [Yarrowia sp. C11]|nr:Zinc finger protein [Yarrowia sp. C11]KAG5370848.1 Zinc finger protein [Yarrowia sp. E02]